MTESHHPSAQDSGTGAPQLPPQASQRAVEVVSAVKDRHEDSILHIEGVVGVGVGIGETDSEEAAIEVYTRRPPHELKHAIPDEIEGISVRIVETGEIFAF